MVLPITIKAHSYKLDTNINKNSYINILLLILVIHKINMLIYQIENLNNYIRKYAY